MPDFAELFGSLGELVGSLDLFGSLEGIFGAGSSE